MDAVEVDALARGEIDAAGVEVLHGAGTAWVSRSTSSPCCDRPLPGRSRAGTSSPSSPASASPGRGGVRVEDLVIVSENGPEVLTAFTKDLLRVE